MTSPCPTCGSEYVSLGSHWRWNEDCIPQLSSYTKEILRGVIASDGWFGTSGKCIQIENTEYEYLEYLSEELGYLGGDISKRSDKNIYSMNTVSHPKILDMQDRWVVDGDKLWPSSLDLTPTTMSHLYAGDGHKKTLGSGRPCISIACADQSERKEIVFDMFERVGFEPSRWGVWEDSRTGENMVNLVFSCDTSDRMVSYMNEVPGYEYKWWDV